jgi:carbon storage regulator CsrA
MLVLSRRLKESVVIGSNIRVTVADLQFGREPGGGKVRLAFEAPRDVPIFRLELLDPKTLAPDGFGPLSESRLTRALAALSRIAGTETPEGSMARAAIAEIG